MPKISDIISNKFPYEPTDGQRRLFSLFDHLLVKNGPDILLVKGYAGTGKTSIVSTLVNVLPFFNLKYVLLAPTGRAAKVLANYSGKKAFTIHKIIYTLQHDKENETLKFNRIKNYHQNTVFLVDEASMIYDQYNESHANLLKDLMEYIFEYSSNRLILIGDTAQLPPVGHDYSGALDKENLEYTYRLDVVEIELNEVVRQEKSSGILGNATFIRRNIQKNQFQIDFKTRSYKDIFILNREKLEDGIRYAYDKYGIENVIIICRSNRQTIQYNQYIRRSILYYDNRIDSGDLLMIVKNNYFWLDKDSPAGFLANGDFAEILKISNFQDRYGFTFADLDLRLIDYPDHPIIQAKAIIDTLDFPPASLSDDDSKKLYENILADYTDLTKIELAKVLAKDPYLNALQIKFMYAITCHKSQGGQWDIVFLDQGYLQESMRNIGYMRWLYTGITRATQELYLVNFLPEFISNE